MRILILVMAILGAAGCALIAPQTSTSEPQRSRWPNASRTTNEAETLVQYAVYLRRLSVPELNREHDVMRQQVAKSRTDLNRAQLVLFYALPGLPLRDDARALAILESLGKEATSLVVRNFALLLLSLVADNKRLDDSVQNLSSKLKEEQRQSVQLQQKLEALKSIEKSLSERDRGKTPPRK